MEEEEDIHSSSSLRRATSYKATKRTQRFLAASHTSEKSFSSAYHARRIFPKAFYLLSTFVTSAVHGTPLWIAKFVGLTLFIVAILPGFVVFAYYYFVQSDRVVVLYKEKEEGGTSRHYMDVYGSSVRYERISSSFPVVEEEVLKPVVIFLTGGAWIIGYKMWGALMARALVPFGVLVCMPDYRNFPGVTVGEMVLDVDYATQWVLNNCREFGGDPKRVVLVGQSAGAHLGSCVVMRKALMELNPKTPSSSKTTAPKPSYHLSTTYKNKDLRGFIPISGPYNLVSLRGHLHNHGLDQNVLLAMFGNELELHSPYHLFQRCLESLDSVDTKKEERGEEEEDGRRVQVPDGLLPPMCIIHGTDDKTAPCQGAIEFASTLREGGVNVTTRYYPGWSHTDPIIEAPMEGDHTLHRDVYNFVKFWTTRQYHSHPTIVTDSVVFDNHDNKKDDDDDDDSISIRQIEDMKEMVLMVPFDEREKICGRLCPPFLVSIGRFFNPF